VSVDSGVEAAWRAAHDSLRDFKRPPNYDRKEAESSRVANSLSGDAAAKHGKQRNIVAELLGSSLTASILLRASTAEIEAAAVTAA
jgi:hypothetical protein